VPASSVLSVMVVGQRHALGIGEEDGRVRPDSEATVLPLYLDPMTKLYLVALMWCRPWVLDPVMAEPLPRTPEIARAALEVTGAYHELERFDTDQATVTGCPPGSPSTSSCCGARSLSAG
jgi:hypothetical protein